MDRCRCALWVPSLRGDLVVDLLQRRQFLGLERPLQGMTVHRRPLFAWGGSALLLTRMAPVSIATPYTGYAQPGESPPRETKLLRPRLGRPMLDSLAPFLLVDAVKRSCGHFHKSWMFEWIVGRSRIRIEEVLRKALPRPLVFQEPRFRPDLVKKALSARRVPRARKHQY